MLETDRHDELRGSNWSKGLTIDGIFRAFGHIKASELHHVMLFSSARLRTAAVLNVLFVVSVSNQNWFCHHFFNQFFGTDMNWIIQRNPKKKAGFHTPKQLKQKTVLGVSFWVLNCHFCPCYCHPAAWFTVMGVTRSVENQLKISWKSYPVQHIPMAPNMQGRLNKRPSTAFKQHGNMTSGSMWHAMYHRAPRHPRGVACRGRTERSTFHPEHRTQKMLEIGWCPVLGHI